MGSYEMDYPKKVQIGDITVRDGFQHEEIWIPTEAKLFYLEELLSHQGELLMRILSVLRLLKKMCRHREHLPRNILILKRLLS